MSANEMATRERQVAQLLEFLRFESISTDKLFAGRVTECAQWLFEKFRAIGLDAELHRTARHPILVAKNAHRPGRRTLMIYGHYDVQPVDPIDLWESPPFEPRIANEVVFAR